MCENVARWNVLEYNFPGEKNPQSIELNNPLAPPLLSHLIMAIVCEQKFYRKAILNALKNLRNIFSDPSHVVEVI